ncbi:uncharacterized protein LOC108098904 [Drosophila ficusphila]|uniref:uncharacterized protein LOC108098904 n=1 Tax=Drosophila ficusphila TaxID=30025 RepID=UPI0007E85C7D|nr:uncharacterized protein LOC108098904 [Drosophila ficusphila]
MLHILLVVNPLTSGRNLYLNMAPFSACSICMGRTRKMVKDPLSSKQVYVCPKCCNSKLHKKMHSIGADKLKKNVHVKSLANESKACQDKNQISKIPGDGCPTTKSKCYKKLEGEKGNQAIKEEDSRDISKSTQMFPQKITPPLMQLVVIKDRKYVAISETADDE